MEGINWKGGFKSSFAFGFSGIILILFIWIKIDIGLLVFILPSAISGLLLAYLLQEQLQNRQYFIISPIIVMAGLLFSIIACLALGYFLPPEMKGYFFHFFWMSGFISSSISGLLFSITHPVDNKVKTTLISVVCCTGLSLLYGTIYDTEPKEPFLWIAATAWLMVFGLTMGVRINRTSNRLFEN